MRRATMGVETTELLPKQNVHKETAEHPNLQDEQTHRDKNQQHRRRTGQSHRCNRQAEYHEQEEHAIDEDAQRGDSRPKPHSFIEHRDQARSVSPRNFSRENLDSRNVNRPHHDRDNEREKRNARGENGAHIDI